MIDTSYRLPVFQTLQEAWDRVKGAKGTFWLALILFFAIMFGLGLLDGIVATFIPRIEPLIGLINQVIGFLLGMGVMFIGIRRAQDLPIAYDQLFYTFRDTLWLKTIGLYLLQILILVIPMMLVLGGIFLGAASSSPLMIALGAVMSCAGVILTAYLAIRIFLSMAFVLDKQLPPFEALSSSFNATKSNFWPIAGILLLQGLILVVSAIPFGIGLIWSIPLCYISGGRIYKNLSQRSAVPVVS